MYTFLGIYLLALFLKIVGFPGVKEIEWKWFILIPLLYFFWKVVIYAIEYILYIGIFVGGMWGLCELGMWIFG